MLVNSLNWGSFPTVLNRTWSTKALVKCRERGEWKIGRKDKGEGRKIKDSGEGGNSNEYFLSTGSFPKCPQ